MRAKLLILLSSFLVLSGAGAKVDLWAQVSVPKKFDLMITPNKLTKAHQIKEISDKCTICHDLTGELPDGKCLDCHKTIGRRMENKIGYHATFKEPCRECHKEHPATPRSIVSLDEKKFDHNRAAYKLKGKHLDVKCDKCHRKRTVDLDVAFYTEIKFSQCLDCHKDPHESRLGNACESCHTTNDWHGKELTFDHNRDSDFHLTGKHAKVECVKCHKPRQGQILGSAIFRDLDRKCGSCHKDPHEGQFRNSCATCHTANDWHGKELTFDHNRDSEFHLTGKHAKVECVKCHKPRSQSAGLSSAIFRGIKTDCVACHADDPHRGKLGNACQKCHTANDWRGKELTFNHNRDSKYHLDGKHADVDCLKCHKPPPGRTALGFAVFKGIKFPNCSPCHTDPHKGEYDMIYGPWCLPCHSVAGFTKKAPKFDHATASQFALLGRHAEVKCEACHNRKLVKTVNTVMLKQYQTRCDSCHEDPHANQLGSDCKKCHESAGWKGNHLLFKHNVHAKYQIDNTHKNVACKLCHKNGHYKPIEPTCKTCHTKFFVRK